MAKEAKKPETESEETVSKAVTTTKNQLPAEFAAQIAADAGLGSESANRDDMTIPLIKIAQALSDEVNKRESAYIEGLEVGDFFNTATHQIWKGETGFFFIPVYYEREHLEWTPRSKGGGFNGKHTEAILEKCSPGPKGENFLPNGNEIVVNGTWYTIIVDKETLDFDQAVISLSKTQLKKSRTLMTQCKQLLIDGPNNRKFNPPLFYNLVHAVSAPESNDQGNWMGWKIPIAGNIFQLGDKAGEFYEMAKMMLEAVRSGKIKAAVDTSAPASDGGNGRTIDNDSPGAREMAKDPNIPF